LEIGLIGSPIFGGDLAQGIRFEEFSNYQFSSGPLIVETPEIERMRDW
jgi:hypothetical protein